MKRNILLEMICFLLIVLFMYAAVSKLLTYDTFKMQLSKSPFITAYAGIVAWGLPVMEMLLVIALTIKRTRLFGSYAALFLMTLFTVYIYIMLHFSYYIPCSCGGILSDMGWEQHLWFNIGFVTLSIIAIVLQSVQQKIPIVTTDHNAQSTDAIYAAVS